MFWHSINSLLYNKACTDVHLFKMNLFRSLKILEISLAANQSSFQILFILVLRKLNNARSQIISVKFYHILWVHPYFTENPFDHNLSAISTHLDHDSCLCFDGEVC